MYIGKYCEEKHFPRMHMFIQYLDNMHSEIRLNQHYSTNSNMNITSMVN